MTDTSLPPAASVPAKLADTQASASPAGQSTAHPQNANTTVQRTPAGQPESAADKAAREGRVGNVEAHKPRNHSTLITNPTPAVDTTAPAVEEPLPDTLPASTLAEMNAGREALKRHATVRPGAHKADVAPKE